MHSTAVICNSKRDKRDKTATNDSSMNFHPVYLLVSSIYQPLRIFWKIWTSKKFVLQLCLIKDCLNLRNSESENNLAAGAYMHRKNFCFYICKQGIDFKNLERVSVHLKNSQEKLEVQARPTRFTYLPIQKQSNNFAERISWPVLMSKGCLPIFLDMRTFNLSSI